MRFFSKIVFICNSCFILAVSLRYFYVNMNKVVSKEALGFNSLTSTVIILGYGAVFLNFLFLSSCLFHRIAKKNIESEKWLILSSLILFLLQLYYFIVV